MNNYKILYSYCMKRPGISPSATKHVAQNASGLAWDHFSLAEQFEYREDDRQVNRGAEGNGASNDNDSTGVVWVRSRARALRKTLSEPGITVVMAWECPCRIQTFLTVRS